KTPAADSYAYYQGTSMAAPHVAGVAALLYSQRPSATPAEIRQVLMNTARAFPGSCSGCGAGIIDAAAALFASEESGNQAPNASFTYSANNLTVQFTDGSSDSDGSVVGWNWNFGDGNTSSSQNPSHTYSVAGSYTVMFTVTDNDGASNSTSRSVAVVAGANAAPTADFTVTVTGLTANFTDRSRDTDGTVVAWRWDLGDGHISTAQNPVHTYASAGTYTARITVTDNQGAAASTSQTVTVEQPASNIGLTGSKSTFWFIRTIRLNWSGGNSTNVDIYENGRLYTTTANNGAWSERRYSSVNSSFQVCEAGTSRCSNLINL
ncbi:MAG: PKD domain-containing protein, partial [Gammaproteobacteria bacterium]